jgi:hypothetical protein
MSIRTDTYALATSAGRKPGTPGHDDAVAYLRCRFADLDLLPYRDTDDWEHSYTAKARGRRVTMTNLIGVIPGTDRTLAPIVIGAHYDSVIESYCADDNASSVAVVLNVAERLSAAPLRRDVVIAAFDGEEPPFFHSPAMGSTRLVEDVLGEVHLAIVMDLIGHPTTLPGTDPHLSVVTGVESHPNLRSALIGVDLPLLVVDNKRVGDMSDHHAFRLAGKPFLFLSSGEWEHYHTEDDLPEYLDYTKLQRVADAVERFARNADVVELGAAQPHDIEDLEAARFDTHLPADLIEPLRHGVSTREALPYIIGGLRASMWGERFA